MMVNTGQEGAALINCHIGSLEFSAEKKNRLVILLITEAEKLLLPIKEFSWLEDDDRACYWVWGTILQSPLAAWPNQPLPFFFINSQETRTAPGYQSLGLKTVTTNTEERLEEIVKYFDRAGQPPQWQFNLINELKVRWIEIYNARKPFPWLKQDNVEQCDWAWNYISKPNLLLGWYNTPPVLGFSPTKQEEKYLAIYAAFDCWTAPPDSKKLFCHNFNKAWHQKKHRDSRQGKKVCNLVLREDVKNKLDQMAYERDITLNRLVEALVENEYTKRNQN